MSAKPQEVSSQPVGSVVVMPMNTQRLAYRRERAEGTSIPTLLSPTNVLEMIARRKDFQIVKFRTTCSDPVPNW